MDPHLSANRANWDDRTEIHVRSQFYDVDAWLRDEPGPRRRELDALGAVDGLTLVHLQCHFGLDTLQWARAGARVTGLDFSSTAIDAARDVARRAGLDDRATFVCANVYDAVDALEGATFDVVYISLGALTWLPSVDRWAEQAATLVTPGGRLYLHDCHPLSWALDVDGRRLAHTYFEEAEPHVDDSGETYTDSDVDGSLEHARTYEWNHSLGEIVTALMRHGLRIDTLTEHDWTVYPQFPWLERGLDDTWTIPGDEPRIPLTYTVVATRP
ncbi:MAG: class I SAM-dependent methyltransferase [Acidimicrobiia bacterium]